MLPFNSNVPVPVPPEPEPTVNDTVTNSGFPADWPPISSGITVNWLEYAPAAMLPATAVTLTDTVALAGSDVRPDALVESHEVFEGVVIKKLSADPVLP